MSTKTIQSRGVPTRLAWWMTIAVMGVAAAGTLSPRPSLHAAVGVLTRFVGPTSSLQPGPHRERGVPRRRQPGQRQRHVLRRAVRSQPTAVHRARTGRALGRRLPPRRQQGLRREHRQRDRLDPRASLANGIVRRPHVHVPVETEPYGLALTPNGTKLYVTNSRSDTVSVIDTATEAVIATIRSVPSRAASPSRTTATRTTTTRPST